MSNLSTKLEVFLCTALQTASAQTCSYDYSVKVLQVENFTLRLKVSFPTDGEVSFSEIENASGRSWSSENCVFLSLQPSDLVSEVNCSDGFIIGKVFGGFRRKVMQENLHHLHTDDNFLLHCHSDSFVLQQQSWRDDFLSAGCVFI